MPGERRARRGKARATPISGRSTRGKKSATSDEQVAQAKKPLPTNEEKAAYRSAIEGRLLHFGWTKVWENIQQQMRYLRARLDTERERRKEERFDSLRQLLAGIKKNRAPLVQFQVRRLGKPPRTEYPCPPIGYSDLKEISQEQAFPEIADVHEWPVIKSLLEADTSADELEQAFNGARSSEIYTMIHDMLPKIEGEILKPTLIVESNPFRDLSDDMKRLLRADSLFMVYDWNEGPHIINSSRNRAYTYKDLLSISVGDSCRLRDLAQQVELPMNRITFHNNAHQVARELLKDIGRPDASYLELECDLDEDSDFGLPCYEGEWICGRCIDKEPKIWQGIVEHHVDERIKYRSSQAELARRKITYNDMHGSSSSSNRPMIRYYSTEVAREMWSYGTSERDAVQCQICSRYPTRHDVQGPKKLMSKHLWEVHGINQPKFGTHYSSPMTIYPY